MKPFETLERQTEEQFHEFFLFAYEQVRKQSAIELKLFETGLRLAEIEYTQLEILNSMS